MSLTDLLGNLIPFVTELGLKLLKAFAILVIGRILIKWMMKTVRSCRIAQKSDPTVFRFLSNAINILLHTVLVISIIGILGVPIASIITVLASAGVAIGLALQGALSNLAGGIMILIFRPFRLNDYIEAGSFSGTVKDIGIIYTVLCTPDNRTVTIPNGTVMGKEIVNYSMNGTRRVDFTFSVAYGTDIARVRSILLEEADRHTLTLREPPPFCRLSKQNGGSLDFALRVWTSKENYWQVNFDLLEAISKRLVAERIEVPFKKLNVHIAEGNNRD